MYHSNTWRILAPKYSPVVYSPDKIKFLLGNPITHSEELDSYIDRVWDEELRVASNVGSVLSNGPLLRLDRLDYSKDEALSFWIALTFYKEYKATCLPEYRAKFEEEFKREIRDDECANTFSPAIVPITLDDQIIIFERSYRVSEFKGCFNVSGGGVWDGNPIVTYKAILSSSNELFDRCIKIAKNELKNYVSVDESSQRLLGAYGSTEYKDNIVSFMININNESNELIKMKSNIIGDGFKHSNLVLVKFKEGTLADFLNKNIERIPNTVLPAIILSGAYKFGEDWPLSINGVKRLIEP